MITNHHNFPTASKQDKRGRPTTLLADLDVSGSRYSREDRLVAATHFLVTGSMAQVSRSTGIPESTLSGWRRSEWWATLVAELRTQYDEELDGKLTGLLHDAVDHLVDTVDGGDTVLVKDKSGVHRSRRKPLSGRDLAVVTGIVFDKRSLLRRLPTSIRENVSQDKLKVAAERFEELAEQYRERQIRVVDQQ